MFVQPAMLLFAAALGSGPRVALSPGVVGLHEPTAITVAGASRMRSLEVRLAGATDAAGRPVGWVRLHRVGTSWQGTPRPPTLLGVYPVELRERTGRPVIRSSRWLLRVLGRGTLANPSFGTAREVPAWWVRTVPPRARLVAVRQFRFPENDRRDRRLHRLFVISFRLLAPWPPVWPKPTLVGTFVTAVRDGFRGRWRFLETTTMP